MKLSVENLTVVRGLRRVIDRLSCTVASGETLVLTGPNGAGKTTLIRTIAGFLSPASGDVRVEGGDPEKEIAEQCHYVGHANGIKVSLTVRENLAFWARFLGEEEGAEPRVDAALDRFGLTRLARIPAAYLSAGQKRRVGLARLLVADRPLWLLDEPTASLDRAATGLVAAAITDHVGKGGLVLAATHVPLGLDNARELELGAPAPTAVEAP